MELMAGILLGFLSGMGVGGGSLLLLWLTAVVGMDAETARCINLLFFFPAALISTGFRLKSLSIKSHLFPMAIGCISTAVCFFLSQNWNPTLLRKGFGVVLLVTAIRELRVRPK